VWQHIQGVMVYLTHACGLVLDVSVLRRTISSRSSLNKNLQRLGLGRLTSLSCLGYLLFVPKTLFCPNFASHINKMSQISSRYYGSVDTNKE